MEMEQEIEAKINDGSLGVAEQLILTRGVDIIPCPDALKSIQQNFKPHQKMSIYVAAGKVGTGKSSHQNALLKRLAGNLLDENAPFDVKRTIHTLTLGVWVYPRPLYSHSYPDVQILVVDLEGMDGLKDQDAADTMVNLLKIYLFGMLISSVFSVHVESKVDGTTIEVLKKAFGLCHKLKSELDIEPPRIFLLLKDTDSDECEDDIQFGKSLIDMKLEKYEHERSQLIIKGRGSPPETFRKSLARNCRGLSGTLYLAVIDELIDAIGQNPKMNPTLFNTLIDLEGFVKLVDTACRLLNKKTFEQNFIVAIEFIKLEKVNEIYTNSLNMCVERSIEKAKNNLLSYSIEEFKAEIEKDVNEDITLFEKQVFQVVKPSVDMRNWTEKHKGIFRATTKAMGAIEIFTRRKIEVEENEKLRKEHENKLEEQMVLTEKARKCAENLQNQMIKLDEEHKQEMARNQQQHEERVRQLAHETMQKIKQLQDEGTAISEQHKAELARLCKEYQENIARYENDLLDGKAKLENAENNRKADNERYNQEIQQLRQESKDLLNKISEDAQAKRRDIEGQIHEREIAWKNEQHAQELAHMRKMQELQSQLSAVQAEKNNKRSDGFWNFITGIVTNPLQTLAMSIVKAIKL